jgi:DNA-binding response OmpR family regulator
VTAHRIVIVEDDEPTMEMLRDALGIAGYSVETMTTGRDACERPWTTLPGTVLMIRRSHTPSGTDGLTRWWRCLGASGTSITWSAS